jgi:hypothetical protein
VHAYWVLPESIPKDMWLPVANRLKAVCTERSLYADPACTTDAARILRVPETTNFKNPDAPLPVEYISGDGLIDLFEFAKALGAPEPSKAEDALPFEVPDHVKNAGMDGTSKALMGQNNIYKFGKILALGSNGCAQINHIVADQASIEEPLWRAGLSIAHLCEDEATAIHEMSHNHPQYDPSDTVYKAGLTKGPYTCDTFDSLRPGVCSECPHKGKFGSPIVLGKEIAAATEEDNVVQAEDANSHDTRTYVIPAYPFPFFRGKHGGVYLKGTPNSDGVSEDKLIYENDFYVVKRMYDQEQGEVLWLRLHLPKDGVREF